MLQRQQILHRHQDVVGVFLFLDIVYIVLYHIVMETKPLKHDVFALHTDLHMWMMKLKTIMDADKAVLWLSTPNNAFNNRVPLDMIKEGKTEELNRMICEVGEGAFL